ncbi:MAG TPA: glycosyltransferase family 2 protein, partial [Gemmataceae bacterium]
MSDPAAPEEPAGISMILPVHNRADQLGPAAERWAAALEALGRPYEILAVDDGSTDATAEVLAKLAEQYPHLRVLRHEQRRGFGAALRTAIPEARFPLLFYTSLDYPYEPQDLARLLARLEEKDPETGLRLHLVTGFRTGRDAPPLPRLFGKLWRGFWNLLLDLGLTPPPGWLGTRAKIYAWANRMLFGLRVLDVNSAFKLFRKSIFP